MSNGTPVEVYFARPDMVCRRCAASGGRGTDVCPDCAGEGWLEIPRLLHIELPAGTQDGDVLTAVGQGRFDWAARTYGDLQVRCLVEPSTHLGIEDGELVSTVRVTQDMATGGSFVIETPAGDVRAELAGPLWDGREYVLPGQGMRRPDGEGRFELRVRVTMAEGRSQWAAPNGRSAASEVAAIQELLRHGAVDEALGRAASLTLGDALSAPGFAVLGAALAKAGRDDEAIPVLWRSVRLAPREARPWRNLAVLYRRRGVRLLAILCAYASLARQPGSAHSQELWDNTVADVFMPITTASARESLDLSALNNLRREVFGRYFETALALTDGMIRRSPESAYLYHQRAAVLILQSIETGAPMLGTAFWGAAKASEVDSRGADYARDRDALLEHILSFGGVRDLVDVARRLLVNEDLETASRVMVAAADKAQRGDLDSWYGVNGAADEPASASRSTGTRDAVATVASVDRLAQQLSRLGDLTNERLSVFGAAQTAIEERVPQIEGLLEPLCLGGDESVSIAEWRTVATAMRQLSSALRGHLSESNEPAAPTVTTVRRLRADLLSNARSLVELTSLVPRTADARSISVGEWSGRVRRILEQVVQGCYSATSTLTSTLTGLQKPRGLVCWLKHAATRQTGRSGEGELHLCWLVAAVRAMHQHLLSAPDDLAGRQLLTRFQREFGQQAQALLGGGYAARADLFQNTLDAVQTGAAGDLSFVPALEEFWTPNNLALLDWAAQVLALQPGTFTQEFVMSAREGCYALTNYRIAHARPGTTEFLRIPLSQVSNYELRTAAVTRVHAIWDMMDGSRLTLNDVLSGDAVPEDAVRWAVSARMWTNLPDDQTAILRTGQTRRPPAPPLLNPTRSSEHPSSMGARSLPAASMPVCPECGAQTETEDQFCRQCGAATSVRSLPAPSSSSGRDEPLRLR